MSFGAKPCPPSARTLTFSNSLKWHFTAWPARLPPSSWLWLPEILRTTQTPFTDEQTISNSQPIHLVCVSLWRVSSIRFSMLTYSPPRSHFMTTRFSLLVLMVRTPPSCSQLVLRSSISSCRVANSISYCVACTIYRGVGQTHSNLICI